ncbi:Uma2 family endonuclease [Streptomyces sp. NPDC037389]|uniref:Uma2 family endonuclease n=1 Tax=Streptomyces sp. NPDC037389 TaxID=3155369 RepID=UPI0033D67B71
MTIELTNRIEMADSDELSLDMLFDWLERMPVPEGYTVEIVEGAIYMSPQRDNHWDLIANLYDQLRTKYPRARVKNEIRVDYPGHLNGFSSDVFLIKEGAAKGPSGRWHYQDVEFIAEVISRDTAKNDYGPKRDAYALAGVPVYLIVDPYIGQCHVFTEPKDGTYRAAPAVKFGDPIDLTDTVVGLAVTTDEFGWD